MLNATLLAIRLVILMLSGHTQIAVENVALRQQLAVFKRDMKKPKLRGRDRLFWVGLTMIWTDWKSALVIVRPETVFPDNAIASNGIGSYCLDRKLRVGHLSVRRFAP
jgi:hypothetical protein